MITEKYIIENILNKFCDDRIDQKELINLVQKYWKRNVTEMEEKIITYRNITSESFEKISERVGITRQGVQTAHEKACEKIRLDLYKLTKI